MRFKTFRVKNRNNPWYCSEISEMLRKRDAAWRKAWITELCINIFVNCVTGVSLLFKMPNHNFMSLLYLAVKITRESFGKQLNHIHIFILHPYPMKFEIFCYYFIWKDCDAFNTHFISWGHISANAGFSPKLFDHSEPLCANNSDSQIISLELFTNL